MKEALSLKSGGDTDVSLTSDVHITEMGLRTAEVRKLTT